MVAELVLEALELEARVALAGIGPARDEEAGDALGGLGEGEEAVAHGGRHEELVADDGVGVAVDVGGGGGVGPDVAAALLLSEGHADGGGALEGDVEVAGVVGASAHLGEPLGAPLGVGQLAERGHPGKGHGDGARVGGLGLVEHVQQGAAGRQRAGRGQLSLGPRPAVHAVLEGQLHQPVVRGVEAHAVDPPSEPVDQLQLRREPVRLLGHLLVAAGPRGLAERRALRQILVEQGAGPSGGAGMGLVQDVRQQRVARERVIVTQVALGRVEDLVRLDEQRRRRRLLSKLRGMKECQSLRNASLQRRKEFSTQHLKSIARKNKNNNKTKTTTKMLLMWGWGTSERLWTSFAKLCHHESLGSPQKGAAPPHRSAPL